MQLYWGFAFYFYDLRKHYAARIAIDLGKASEAKTTSLAPFTSTICASTTQRVSQSSLASAARLERDCY